MGIGRVRSGWGLEGLEGTAIGRDGDWKGWKAQRLEGIDPDVVDGRLGSGRGLEGSDPDGD